MVRIETGGIVLDLFQDESVELELNVNNVRDIGKIYAPISKTFTVPASDRNNQYFKHYYNVNVDGGFNAYVRTPAQLFVDSEQIFAGYLELIDCIIENDEPKQYEVLVASAAPSLAKTLEAKKIDELTLSSITDISYTLSNIQATWTTPVGSAEIRFGLVDRRGLLSGDGSFSALASGNPVYETDFMPYMRLSTIVKGIIEENGYRYTSDFLDNDIDDVYLMLGRNGGVLSDAEILSSKMIDVSGATNGTAVNYTELPTGGIDEPRWNQLSFGTEIQDPSSQYNPTTSTFTTTIAGKYTFQVKGTAATASGLDFVMITDTEAATNNPFTSNQVQTSQIFTFYPNGSGSFNFNVELPLQGQTAYKFYIRRSSSATASIAITNTQLTIVKVPLSPAGATLDFTSLLPDITQKKFLAEVSRLYNLVFVPDRYDDKLIHIQPYDAWIADGSTFNLTEYVDIAKPVSVKPTTSIQSRSLAFNMGEGEDVLSQTHIEQVKKTHSSVSISDTGNEFAEGETKIESEFINSIIVRDSTSLIQFPIIADDNYESVDIGLRLAFWNGTYTSPTWYGESSLTNVQTAYSTFPQLQPYNDFENPTFNLGFAPPQVQSGIDIPTDNLFTDYWENYISNIYDSDSRLVQLEAHIPASVLNTLKLNDSVIFKNQGYYIQRFTYDTLTERAKIELLKAVRTNPVICNLTPKPSNVIDFRGAVTFIDANGNETQNASENCCNFYGYTWNGSNGKCYLKFDRKDPVSGRNTIPRIDEPKPSPGDPTQSKPLVPIYNPVTKRYEYVLPSDLEAGGNLQQVTDVGATTTNNIVVNGLTATTDPIDAQGDLRAQSNLRFDAYAPASGHNLLIVGTDGTVYTRDEDYYTTEGWVTSQGYATQAWVNSQGFATQVWVIGQGYVDENLSSLSFNVSDGVLTASLSGGTQTTVDLDGRYLQSVSLNDLTDVDAASNKNDGAVMQWSAVLNRFVLSNTLDLRIEGSDLLADNSPTAGQVYQYNGSTFQWATVTSGGVTSLNDIGDVSVPSPNNGDVLSWNGSTWIASAAGGGSADGVVSGATFVGGLLSLQRSLGLPDVSVDLDGRYLRDFTEVDPKGVASIAFSGTNTKTLTITLRDSSTVQASFTDLQGGGGSVSDGVVNGASFNTSNGVLTLNRTESLPDVTVDLDGRYSTFSGFSVRGDVGGSDFIGSGQIVTFAGGAGISTQSSATANTIDISIPNDGVTEAMLDVANTPSNLDFLMYDAGDLVWAKPTIPTFTQGSSALTIREFNTSNVFTLSGATDIHWQRIGKWVTMKSGQVGIASIPTTGSGQIEIDFPSGAPSCVETTTGFFWIFDGSGNFIKTIPLTIVGGTNVIRAFEPASSLSNNYSVYIELTYRV